jgi:hypothetical protein
MDLRDVLGCTPAMRSTLSVARPKTLLRCSKPETHLRLERLFWPTSFGSGRYLIGRYQWSVQYERSSRSSSRKVRRGPDSPTASQSANPDMIVPLATAAFFDRLSWTRRRYGPIWATVSAQNVLDSCLSMHSRMPHIHSELG